jgi:hypothetical protein
VATCCSIWPRSWWPHSRHHAATSLDIVTSDKRRELWVGGLKQSYQWARGCPQKTKSFMAGFDVTELLGQTTRHIEPSSLGKWRPLFIRSAMADSIRDLKLPQQQNYDTGTDEFCCKQMTTIVYRPLRRWWNTGRVVCGEVGHWIIAR